MSATTGNILFLLPLKYVGLLTVGLNAQHAQPLSWTVELRNKQVYFWLMHLGKTAIQGFTGMNNEW